MMARFLLALRGWWFERQHPHLSRAWTLRHPRTGRFSTYVVCLECGREFEYDLRLMRATGRQVRRRIEHPDAVAIQRAALDDVGHPPGSQTSKWLEVKA